ncbi:MAG: WG repeat-containing protein [Chitinophagaceae bacterium]|nr:WG repeat-containing protein [Chitinophagaceae bacterium]
MKKTFLITTLLFCFGLIKAQTINLKSKYTKVAEKSSEGMIAVMSSKYTWGFVDEKTGSEIVFPKYDKVYNYSEGLACVTLNDKSGFIDKAGKEVIPLIYNDVKVGFRNGIAPVNKGATRDPMMGMHGGYWGFINKEGKEVIPFKFEGVESYSKELIMVKVNNLCGYIDRVGKEIIKPRYIWINDFSEGFATGRRYLTNEELTAIGKNPAIDKVEAWTFFDTKGNEIITPKYNAISPPKEGLLMVTIVPAPYQPEKYGYIDKKGKVAIEIKYDGSYGFSEGLASVYNRDENKWGYIDTKGNLIIAYKYSSAYNFKDGVAKVKIGTIDYLLDKYGKETNVPAH